MMDSSTAPGRPMTGVQIANSAKAETCEAAGLSSSGTPSNQRDLASEPALPARLLSGAGQGEPRKRTRLPPRRAHLTVWYSPALPGLWKRAEQPQRWPALSTADLEGDLV